jgi:zinc-ribbon domain
MYCPQCGQQQASDSMRFCSRCGFPLEGAMVLLSHGGMIPYAPIEGEQRISPKRKGVKQGAMLFLLGAVIVPAMGVLYGFTDFNIFAFFCAISAVLFFLGGLLRMLYAALFEEGAPARPLAGVSYGPPPIAAPPIMTALPPAATSPVGGWRRRPETAEIGQPPSVTDNTTRLLQKREEEDS